MQQKKIPTVEEQFNRFPEHIRVSDKDLPILLKLKLSILENKKT